MPTEKNIKSTFRDMRSAHIGIRTSNYDSLIQWYIEKLDFRLIHKYNVGELLLAFLAPANDDNFLIEIYGSNESGNQVTNISPVNAGLQHFCIEVDNVDNTLNELNLRGVSTFREPFNVPPISKRCGFITDVQGNVIEFMQSI